MADSIQQEILKAALAKEAAKNKKPVKKTTEKVKFEKKTVLDKGPILDQFKYLLKTFLIPAVHAGIEHRGWKVKEEDFIKEFKRNFVKWVTTTTDSFEEETKEWVKYRAPMMKMLKKKSFSSLYMGVKKALRILEDKVAQEHGTALTNALHYLREDVANGGDGFSVVEDMAMRFGINPRELEYFWKKIAPKVQQEHAKEVAENEKKEQESKKEDTKIDITKDPLFYVHEKYGPKPWEVIQHERKIRPNGAKDTDRSWQVDPEDWELYTREDDDENGNGYKAPEVRKTKEQLEQEKTQKDEAKKQKAKFLKKVNARFNNLWKVTKRFVPRAIIEVIDEWELVYDKDDTLVTQHIPRQVVDKVKSKFFIIPDATNEQFIIPQVAMQWDNNKIKRALVEASVRAFFSKTNLLKTKKLTGVFRSVFISETDIDYIVDILNRIAEPTMQNGEKILRNVMGKDYPIIESLRTELADPNLPDADKQIKWQQWKAEHGDHFLAKLQNKAMIPLFHKWVTEACIARVFNQRIPDSVPYPVIDFLNKLASHEEVARIAAAKLVEARFELARNAPDEIELDEELLRLSKKIKRRVANMGLNGLPKALQPTI